jgi:hypothetical protein
LEVNSASSASVPASARDCPKRRANVSNKGPSLTNHRRRSRRGPPWCSTNAEPRQPHHSSSIADFCNRIAYFADSSRASHEVQEIPKTEVNESHRSDRRLEPAPRRWPFVAGQLTDRNRLLRCSSPRDRLHCDPSMRINYQDAIRFVEIAVDWHVCGRAHGDRGVNRPRARRNRDPIGRRSGSREGRRSHIIEIPRPPAVGKVMGRCRFMDSGSLHARSVAGHIFALLLRWVGGSGTSRYEAPGRAGRRGHSCGPR